MSELQIPLAGFGPEPKPLPKGHKAFERLVKKIEEARAALDTWAALLKPYQAKYTRDLVPLNVATRALRIRFLARLDRALHEKGLNRTERRDATQAIAGMAAALLAEGDDPELRALYLRYAEEDYEESVSQARAAFEEIFGANPNHHDPFEELFGPASGDTDQEDRRAGKARRKVPTEQTRIRQSIRALYRKLASALHPDREADPEQRDRKTALMQKANQAYANDELLPLLELRRELDPAQGAWADEDEEDVKLYTRALKRELGALEEEVLRTEVDFRMRFAIDPLAPLTPRNALRLLTAEVKEARTLAADLEQELVYLEDTAHLKRWLRALRDGSL